MTFQAFRGPSVAQIAFMILLATSIGDTVTQCTAHDKGVTNAVTKISGQLDHSKMHNRPCAKQLYLKYFRDPLFSETEAEIVTDFSTCVVTPQKLWDKNPV